MIKAIISILEKLGCKHDWDLRIKHQVKTGWGGEYTSYTFICNKCGKFKRWDKPGTTTFKNSPSQR